MLSNEEVAHKIAEAEAKKTEDKQHLATEILDLMRQQARMHTEVAAGDRALMAMLSRLQKLMDIDEFMSHAGLTRAELAPWLESGQNHRAKTRTKTTSGAPADRHSTVKERTRPSKETLTLDQPNTIARPA